MVESGVCEPSRLLHILGMITAGRPLYNSDRAYLDRIASRLADKESALRRENRRIRRVLGGARPGEGAAEHSAATAAPAPEPPPAPVIDAAAPAAARQGAPPSPSGRRAFRSPPPRDAPSPGAPTPRPAPGAPNAGKKPSGGLPLGAPPPRPAPAAPGRASSQPVGRALIDDASLDAILERRDRQRRSGARERAAEAVAAPQSSRPSQSSSSRETRPAGALRAGPDSPPRGKIAGRLRGMVAGRR